jgi:hypothetical protein
MAKQERPTQVEREQVAQEIREGGPAAVETMMEEVGLTEETPILDEANRELAEGGGPIADAVSDFESESALDD